MCRITWLALIALLGSGMAAAGAPLAPFDFTGRWTGVVVAALQTFAVEADLTSSSEKKFSGTAAIEGVPCQVRGKRKRKVVLRVRCDDGTKGKLTGILDLVNGAVAGAGHLARNGRRAAATFAIERAVVPACGNGVIESGEQCDDGNTADGDGCGATCAVEVSTIVDEVEPNNAPVQATPVPTLPAVTRGAVDPAADEDFYRIELSGTDLVLETFDANGPGSCGPDTDTIIEVRASNGTTIVGLNDDGGIGTCSRLELHGLTPGVYFPCVRAFAAAVPAYQLVIVGP